MQHKTLQSLSSKYYLFDTYWGKLHVHISGTPEKIIHISGKMDPIGSELSGLIGTICNLATVALKHGAEPKEITKYLSSVKSARVSYVKGMQIESLPHAISVALQEFMNARN